ncbi:DUF4231 domain-containing protein [Micromonospora sp. PLK6-60]|uniref:SLATT domain-containing protein n=1 Tax=Micromonospora sp. PLK6-60 TaxID=2873383 RepID=UPI001CA673AD|nr:SLATT domain-containing protein [Micromonospora sp. PLK6-60]MBY8873989.1 DUF4231 domain-containing protein [Micromonospora sp. PLK6-60]
MIREKQSSGVRLPGSPPADADTLDVAMYYLEFYLADFSRARGVAKRRARVVVVATAAANGLIALLGATTTFTGLAWLGLCSVGVTAIIAVLAAWDGLFRHRELWIQRSVIVSRLHTVQREVYLRRASGEGRSEVANHCMLMLNQILDDDLTAWTEIRNAASAERRESSEGIAR